MNENQRLYDTIEALNKEIKALNDQMVTIEK